MHLEPKQTRLVPERLRIPGAASLALWSYAVYLVHKPVFMALRPERRARQERVMRPLFHQRGMQ